MKIRAFLLSLWVSLCSFGAITDRYVTDAGAGLGDGTSIANAMSFATFVDYMSTGGSFTAAAGDRFNIIGTISSRTTTTDTFVNGGSSTSPVVIRGWKSDDTSPYAGRTNGNGALITTDYPTITYTTGRMNCTGTFIVIENLVVTGAPNSGTVTIANDSVVLRSAITNSGTGASAVALNCASTGALVFDNDVTMSGASGGSVAISATSLCNVDSNRITVTQAIPAISCNNSAVVYGNTIYSSGGVAISMQTTTGRPWIRNNTIYGCSSDGVDIITGTTALQRIIGNMVTDNGGYAVDFNSSSVAGFVAYNRTRDNTSGAYNLATDWVAATSYGNVTTDTGGASTDYVNAGSGDLNLISGSPATSVGIPRYSSIGALQRDQTGSAGSSQHAYAFSD